MKNICSLLKFPPSEFWKMTLIEYVVIMDGYVESMGGEDSESGELTDDDIVELNDMMRRL